MNDIGFGFLVGALFGGFLMYLLLAIRNGGPL